MIPLVMVLLSLPTVFAIYKQVQTPSTTSQTPRHESGSLSLTLSDSLSGQESLLFQHEGRPGSINNSSFGPSQPQPEPKHASKQHNLDRSSTDASDKPAHAIEVEVNHNFCPTRRADKVPGHISDHTSTFLTTFQQVSISSIEQRSFGLNTHRRRFPAFHFASSRILHSRRTESRQEWSR